MIRIENTQVFGFEAALRDMRNPKESWSKSDSTFYDYNFYKAFHSSDTYYESMGLEIKVPEVPVIGPNDLQLLTGLVRGGSEHRKLLRCINVWCVIYPTRSVWQEIDTYKIGTVRNSCSTMHKLGHRGLSEEEDFKFIPPPEEYGELDSKFEAMKAAVLDYQNSAGEVFRQTKDYNLVRSMKSGLTESFIQRAGYHCNYENLLNMFAQRHNHRLEEWRWTNGVRVVDGKISICDWIYALPYMPELIKCIRLH